MGYWGGSNKRTYHHTAPVNALYGLHEALVMLQEEGLENAWARHEKNYHALRAGVEALGLKFIVREDSRLPQLNAIAVPANIDEAKVRQLLLSDYNLEIGAGLGALAGRIFRVGLMGQTSSMKNVILFVSALKEVIARLQHSAGYSTTEAPALRA